MLRGSSIQGLFRRAVRVLAVVSLLGVASSGPAWSQIQTVIGRANLDGSNIETLRIEDGWGCNIAVHAPSGKVYWSHSDDACNTAEQEIRRFNLDGSGFETVVIGRPMHDLAGNNLYWHETAAPNTQGFYRSDLNGNGVELLGTFPFPVYEFGLLRVDSSSESLFWNRNDTDKGWPIGSRKSNFDASGELFYPFRPFNSLALLSGGTQIVGATAQNVPFSQEHWIARADVDGNNYEVLFEFGDQSPSARRVEFVAPWVYWQRFFEGDQTIQRASSCRDYRIVLQADFVRDYTVDEAVGKIYWMTSNVPTPPNDPFADSLRNCEPGNVPAASVTGALVTAGLIALAMLWMARRRVNG